MDGSPAFFLGYRSAIDYCQPEVFDNGCTRKVLDYLNEQGVKIDIRKSDWQYLNERITDSLRLFTFLKDEATAALRDADEDSTEVVEEFVEATLQPGRLVEEEGFSINEAALPSIDRLSDAVREMGLEGFRAWADDRVQNCEMGQENLNLMVEEKFERGGQSVGFFEAAVRQDFNGRDADLLIATYVWSTTVDGILLSRHESPIKEQEDLVYDKLSDQRFSIHSSRELEDKASKAYSKTE